VRTVIDAWRLCAGRRLMWLALGVFAVAFAARLVPVLGGGGLFALDTYDDGVHYSSALAWVQGRWPYRDFLLLHPPGIVLALAPFAAFGSVTREGLGFAVGRVAWMVLGATTAVLVVLLLRRFGWVAALLGGLWYALYPPALRAERTTMLEGLTSALLALALVLIGSGRLRSRYPAGTCVAAGALLGFAAVTKIWGVVVVAIVLGWVVVIHGFRRGWQFLLAALVTAAAVGLPFFARAPSRMWRMVVTDQLVRQSNQVSAFSRLRAITGFRLGGPAPSFLAVVLACGVLALLIVIAVSRRYLLAPLLLVGMGLVVLVSPSFYPHYPAALAVPLALVVGVGAGWLYGSLRARARPVAVSLVAGVLLALAVYAYPLSNARIGLSFPGRTLAASLRPRAGCVTADDAVTLVEMNVFGRNIERGCAVVVDLGGYSLHLTPGRPGGREENPVFQYFALRYLSSGDTALNVRFSLTYGFSRHTLRVIEHWPIIARHGRYELRHPLPATGADGRRAAVQTPGR
jgi:alpha-1,2-mannosyltransferase